MTEGRTRSDSGQAAVESAMVMPLMVFLALGLVQLTMLQQAKIMTEYAAFQAARTGIVWNGHNERMHDAAVMALLPTLGRTDTMSAVGEAWTHHQTTSAALAALNWGGPAPRMFRGAPLTGLVRVDTVNPAQFSELDGIWKLPGGASWEELEFDGPDGYPEVAALDGKLDHFFHLENLDPADEMYRKATVLSIRVRYWYEMRVPFANWIIFVSWFATNADVALHGAIDRPTLADENMMGSAGVAGLGSLGKGISHAKGFPTVSPEEMAVLWGLSTGAYSDLGKRFYLPLSGTYSMRMQSNFHRKWLMHESPGWGL